MSKVVDALSCKCPNCKRGKIFKKGGNILMFNIPKMNPVCQECGFKFEKETGFFFGAMFVSYTLAAAQMIASLLLFWYMVDLSPLRVFVVIIVIALLLSTFNYKLSRSIWIYLFYKNNN